MVDMRKRFRGNYPAGASKELEGQGKGPMLYAGRPAVGEVVGTTSGDEDTKVKGNGGG